VLSLGDPPDSQSAVNAVGDPDQQVFELSHMLTWLKMAVIL
jgi:hypothetical protein